MRWFSSPGPESGKIRKERWPFPSRFGKACCCLCAVSDLSSLATPPPLILTFPFSRFHERDLHPPFFQGKLLACTRRARRERRCSMPPPLVRISRTSDVRRPDDVLAEAPFPGVWSVVMGICWNRCHYLTDDHPRRILELPQAPAAPTSASCSLASSLS